MAEGIDVPVTKPLPMKNKRIAGVEVPHMVVRNRIHVKPDEQGE